MGNGSGNAPDDGGDKGADSDIAEMSFEQALAALEEVVSRLESGNVPLEESMTMYERGEKLRAHCQARLDAAQSRIEKIVTRPDGQVLGTEKFDSDQ